MHRVISGAPDGLETDHINHRPLDNRRANLRVATRSQNAACIRMRADNTSGYRGVGWDKRRGCWVAEIHVANRHIHLGHFRAAEDAAQSYDTAARQHFGPFAFQNFPGSHR
jgi:hypothetical protein